MRFLTLITSLSLFVTVACVKELPLTDEGTQVYPFVSGGIEIGTDQQQLRLGLTARNAVRVDEFPEVDVVLKDLTSGESISMSPCGEAQFCGNLLGVHGHDYQLEATSPRYGTFTSRIEQLESTSLVVSGEAKLSQRVDRDGTAQTRNYVQADLSFTLPETDARGALLLYPTLTWSFTDNICGGLDVARVCYKEDEALRDWKLIDLSQSAVGSTNTVSSGEFFIDRRFNQSAVISVEVTRLAEEAASYFRGLNVALSQRGDLFAEAPLTTPGNMVSSDPNFPMLGYFTVKQVDTIHVAATAEEIKDRAGGRACSWPLQSPLTRSICCECLNLEGATDVKPPFWP